MAKQTNEQKYRTAEERIKAFGEFCRKQKECSNYKIENGRDGIMTCDCMAYWLTLEAEDEKPEPCFYCGHEMHYRVEHRNFTDKHWLECTNGKCNFKSPKYESRADAISAHNRVARAVRAADNNNN